jgi:hypothetical protein
MDPEAFFRREEKEEDYLRFGSGPFRAFADTTRRDSADRFPIYHERLRESHCREASICDSAAFLSRRFNSLFGMTFAQRHA